MHLVESRYTTCTYIELQVIIPVLGAGDACKRPVYAVNSAEKEVISESSIFRISLLRIYKIAPLCFELVER
jgi:hypothetical protein